MKRYIYKLIQDGMIVAMVEGTVEEDVKREISHYYAMYSQDGAVEIKRKVIEEKKK